MASTDHHPYIGTLGQGEFQRRPSSRIVAGSLLLRLGVVEHVLDARPASGRGFRRRFPKPLGARFRLHRLGKDLQDGRRIGLGHRLLTDDRIDPIAQRSVPLASGLPLVLRTTLLVFDKPLGRHGPGQPEAAQRAVAPSSLSENCSMGARPGHPWKGVGGGDGGIRTHDTLSSMTI